MIKVCKNSTKHKKVSFCLIIVSRDKNTVKISSWQTFLIYSSTFCSQPLFSSSLSFLVSLLKPLSKLMNSFKLPQKPNQIHKKKQSTPKTSNHRNLSLQPYSSVNIIYYRFKFRWWKIKKRISSRYGKFSAVCVEKWRKKSYFMLHTDKH